MINSFRKLCLTTARRFSQFPDEFRGARKARSKVIEKYEALPAWGNVTPKDPFDYPLRSRENIREYQELNPPNFPVEVDFKIMMGATPTNDSKGRTIRLIVKVKDMKLTPKQKARMIFLLGDRYKPKEDLIKIKVDSFQKVEENYMRGLEILKELYLETIRAP